MPRTTFYDQNVHSVIVDGLAVEDFHEGEDVIQWEPQGDNIVATRGTDRNALSFGSPRPGTLTLRLKPTSPSILRLQELAELAHNGRTRLVSFLVTTGVEDVLDGIDCGVNDMGFTTGGPTMQARVFQIVCANYNLRET